MTEMPLKLNLSEEVERDCKRYVLDLVRASVEQSKTRDEDMHRWRDTIHGIPQSYASTAWEGACQIEDGLTQEARAQIVAQVLAGANRFPLATVDGEGESKERAPYVEQQIARWMKRENYLDALFKYVDNAVCYPFGVKYMGWEMRTRRKRDVMYWDGESYATDPLTGEEREVLISAKERMEGVNYTPRPVVRDERISEGREHRAVAPYDFYTYPVDIASLSQASAVMERQRYSDNDLLNGIEDYGFDEESVMKCIEMGRSSSEGEDEHQAQRAEAWGLEVDTTINPDYECFVWYGYLPKLWQGGKARLPRELWNDLFVAVVCPAADCVLKLDFSPYYEFPYDCGSIMPDSDSIYGMGICPMLEAEQQEATHYRRLSANVADLVASPMTIMSDDAWEMNKNQSIYPGGVFREDAQNSVRPYEMPTAGVVITTQMVDYTLGRAARKIAAQGWGQVNQKQPLVAEMEGVMAATDTKFDYFQRNVFAIIARDAKRMLELELQFNPEFRSQFQVDGEDVSLSAEDLAEQYEFNVAQIDQNASESAKVQKDVAITNLVDGYFKFLLETLQTPLVAYHAQKWRQVRDALSHLGVRNPADYIGDMPSQNAQQQLMGAMQGQATDPLMMIQQMLGGNGGGVNAGAGAPLPMGGIGAQPDLGRNGSTPAGIPL